MPPRPSPVYAFTPRGRGFLSQLAAGLQLIAAAAAECKMVETQLVGRHWAAEKQQSREREEKRRHWAKKAEQRYCEVQRRALCSRERAEKREANSNSEVPSRAEGVEQGWKQVSRGKSSKVEQVRGGCRGGYRARVEFGRV